MDNFNYQSLLFFFCKLKKPKHSCNLMPEDLLMYHKKLILDLQRLVYNKWRQFNLLGLIEHEIILFYSFYKLSFSSKKFKFFLIIKKTIFSIILNQINLESFPFEFFSILSKQVEHNKWPFFFQNVLVDLSISFLQIKHLKIGDILYRLYKN